MWKFVAVLEIMVHVWNTYIYICALYLYIYIYVGIIGIHAVA